jgi:hypothetical protein
MEPDKDQIINVAIGDPSLIENIIDRVNKTYKTQFKLLKTEDRGGVEFALIERGSATLDEVFLLGFYYGGNVNELRNRKEIDY